MYVREIELNWFCQVDDRLIFGKAKEGIRTFHNQIRRVLKINDFGKAKQFLRIELMWPKDKVMSFRQLTLIDAFLKENGIGNYKPIDSLINPDIGDEAVGMARYCQMKSTNVTAASLEVCYI